MADPKKIAWSQLRVGLVAIVAMIIAGALILLLTGNGNPFGGRFAVRTFMDDSAGMAEGASVRLNGVLAGKIKTVKLSGETDPKRLVEIGMEIESKFLTEIPQDSLAGISASNLLGDKYINITKGKSATHVTVNGELKSMQVTDIPQLVQTATSILNSFQTVVDRVNGLLAGIDAGQGNIGKLLKDDALYNRADDTVKDVNELVKKIKDSDGTISKLLYEKGLYEDIQRPVKRLDDMLAQLQAGQGSAGKLLTDDALYDDAKKSMADVRVMLDNLKAGKGSAGKLLNDDELATQLNLIATKLNTTIDRINAGQGTIGQLMVNPQLYDSLNGATREAQALVKDMRANPKKFLRIKLALF